MGDIEAGDYVLIVEQGREDRSWVDSMDATIGTVQRVEARSDDGVTCSNGYFYHSSSIRPYPVLKVGDRVYITHSMPEWEDGPWVEEDMDQHVGSVGEVVEVSDKWVRVGRTHKDNGGWMAYPRQVLAPLGFGLEDGAQVVVAEADRDWPGSWMPEMSEFVGTRQTISEYIREYGSLVGGAVLLKDSPWMWPPSVMAVLHKRRRETINGKARALAAEAGYEWDVLTSAERREWRDDARKELGRGES